MPITHNFSFSLKPTNSLTTMMTIAELDQLMDKKKNPNPTLKTQISQGFLGLKSSKTTLQQVIYELPNQFLVKQLKNDPFLMRKLKLTLKNELKLQTLVQEESPYYHKFIPNTLRCTSYREEMEVKKRRNMQKISQLIRVLKLTL